MVDIWKFAKNLPNIDIETKAGEKFQGKVVAVFDAEESGEDADNIAVEMENGEIVSFYANEINSAKEVLR